MMLATALCQAGKPVTVILTAGQSNTAGREWNDSLPDYIKALEPTGFKHCQWSFVNGNTRLADQGGVFRPFWPESEMDGKSAHRFAYDTFVYYLLEQALQEDFYVIKTAYGGTSIDPACLSTRNFHWSADAAFLDSTAAAGAGGYSLLKTFEDNIDRSLDTLRARGLEPDIRCLLWHQGESDRSQAAHYHDNLKQMVEHLRQHLVAKTGDARYTHLPVILGGVPQDSRQYSRQVEEAKQQLASEDGDIYYVPLTRAAFIGDRLHFNRPTAERLGRDVFETMQKTMP